MTTKLVITKLPDLLNTPVCPNCNYRFKAEDWDCAIHDGYGDVFDCSNCNKEFLAVAHLMWSVSKTRKRSK